MKILGFEIKKAERPKPELKECQHKHVDCVNFDEDVYQCGDCGKVLIYIDGKLTPVTIDNMHLKDISGGEIDGIIQF